MIINIGLRNKIIKSGILKNVNCPTCFSLQDFNYFVFGGLVSILFIPFSPKRKEVDLECCNCKKTFHLKDFDSKIRQEIKEEVRLKDFKNPLWQFSGLLICLVLILIGIYYGFESKKNEKKYIENPKVNDVYYIHIENSYTTLKVVEIRKDSIVVFLNSMESSGYSGIDEINVKENYIKRENFSKNQIIKMFNENIIYQIDRE